jgi:hypothetical protein
MRKINQDNFKKYKAVIELSDTIKEAKELTSLSTATIIRLKESNTLEDYQKWVDRSNAKGGLSSEKVILKLGGLKITWKNATN